MKSKGRKVAASARGEPATPAPPPSHRVFLIDDHPMMLDSMRRLIETEPGLTCCGQARSAEEAVSLVMQCNPDIVVTDITLPNRSGLELIKDLGAMCPQVRVLVYSMHDELFYAERALRAGARGYLMKEAGSEMLLDCVKRIVGGEICVSPRIAAKILDLYSSPEPRRSQSPVEKLSDREFDVYQLIGLGKSTKEIADQLHLSPKTVAVHRAKIKEKLGIATATELAHHAIRWATSGAPKEGVK